MGRNYQRGATRERQAQAMLEQDGWVVVRSAGSRSPMDLTCLKAGEQPRVIQVKSDRRGPFAHFGPADRVELTQTATRAGAQAWLLWIPPDRGGPRWISESDWPSA